jgi:hypothetical protein
MFTGKNILILCFLWHLSSTSLCGYWCPQTFRRQAIIWAVFELNWCLISLILLNRLSPLQYACESLILGLFLGFYLFHSPVSILIATLVYKTDVLLILVEGLCDIGWLIDLEPSPRHVLRSIGFEIRYNSWLVNILHPIRIDRFVEILMRLAQVEMVFGSNREDLGCVC